MSCDAVCNCAGVDLSALKGKTVTVQGGGGGVPSGGTGYSYKVDICPAQRSKRPLRHWLRGGPTRT